MDKQIDNTDMHRYYAIIINAICGDYIVKNLSDVLSSLMSSVGIKSAELARKTGVAQPVVSRLMTGVTVNPQVSTIKPIADFFGISLDQLLGLTPLGAQQQFDSDQLSDLFSKVDSIKTIVIALTGIFPILIDGYQKAVSANLTREHVSIDILPLFLLNIKNLPKITDQIQDILSNKYEKADF
jgi:transcriptional regulator with XRE-family HTH domain